MKSRGRVETTKKHRGRGKTYMILPGSRPDPLGNEVHVHLRVRDFGQGGWGRLGSRWPSGRESGGIARHERDEVGSPFVGREEDGIERYHFVHHGGTVIRWCTRTGRMVGRTGMVGEEGYNYGWYTLRCDGGCLTGAMERPLLSGGAGSYIDPGGVGGVSTIKWSQFPKGHRAGGTEW